MRIGIIELITDIPINGWINRIHTAYLTRQYVSITPQVISVWCRQLGHDVFFRTYYGQDDPKRLLPKDLDVVFIATHTHASALAYALSKLYRREKVLTVIGGPHAKIFPLDCLRYFDFVVQECDKMLIHDILKGHFDPPIILKSSKPLTDIPTVEERMPEITASTPNRGRKNFTTLVPMLASVGCPYTCDFCSEWNVDYVALPMDRLKADLIYLSENLPWILLAYHDPNFGVKFDETMDILETIPKRRRNRYAIESSLSILKAPRLNRLRETNCVIVAPGVESWYDYSKKAGVGGKSGRDKMEQVVAHFELLREHVPGLQANFVFGTDADKGTEPVELINEFSRRLPFVFTSVNIPVPLGGTQMYVDHFNDDRILKSMPFAFYCRHHYLVTTIRNYHPLEFYDHLIDIFALKSSNEMLARRILAKGHPLARFINAIRTLEDRQDLAVIRSIREMLATDPQFLAFHEGRSNVLPEFYQWTFEQRLGSYAGLISRDERVPVLQ